MEKIVYERMAKNFAEQLRDILSGATYDQSDELLELIEQMLLDPIDDKPVEKVEELVLAIYSARIDDVEGDAGLEEIRLSEPKKRTDAEEWADQEMKISMDDFIFDI